MNKEILAKAILRSLKAQVGFNKSFDGYLYVHDEGNLEDIFLDGPVDLRQLAESLLDFITPKKDDSLVVTEIASCPSNPVVRIMWGDGVVTYAHFTKEAEIIHKVAKGPIVERMGSYTPEEAMAS